MTTITNLFEQSQLSMASYALNLTPGISDNLYTDKLEATGMSQTQAEIFADTYEVIDQYTDTVSGTGFSGTVFKNRVTGEYAFAIRGTEFPGDIYADFVLADLADIGGSQVGCAPRTEKIERITI